MINFVWKQIREELKPGGDAGGAGSKPEDAKPEPTKDTPPPEEIGDIEYDEFGYEKPKAATPVPGDKKPEGEGDKKPEPEEVKDPATGYGDTPPAVEEDKDEPPPPTKEEPKLDFEIKTEGLPPEEVKAVIEFVKTNEISQKGAQAIIDRRKIELAEVAKLQKKAEIERQKIRSTWDKELREDKTFGGEKFAHNIHKVEKVLADLMPNTKKALTEAKTMLPPYVMRDLANLWEHHYGKKETFHSGQPPMQPAPKKEDNDDPLAFYGLPPDSN